MGLTILVLEPLTCLWEQYCEATDGCAIKNFPYMCLLYVYSHIIFFFHMN